MGTHSRLSTLKEKDSEGGVAWEGDALHQVLGEEKLDKCTSWHCFQFLNKFMVEQHHFKDTNIVSMDGSSSDIEIHMLEEIR
jgi:hypothetical protein